MVRCTSLPTLQKNTTYSRIAPSLSVSNLEKHESSNSMGELSFGEESEIEWQQRMKKE